MKSSRIVQILVFLFVFLVIFSAKFTEKKLLDIQVPTVTPNMIATAQFSIKIGHYADALNAWKSVLSKQPNNAEANYQLGLLLLLYSPSTAPPYFEQAIFLEHPQIDKITQIRNSLRSTLFIQNLSQQAVIIGQILAATDEWYYAIEKFNQAILLEPDYAEAFAFLGESQFHINEDGLTNLEKAISINPESFSANTFMGFYWQRKNQPELALPFFMKAVKINPKDANILIDQANTFAQLDMFEYAIASYQKATILDPGNFNAWIALAIFSIEQEIQVQSIGLPAAHRALLIDKENVIANTLIGQAYLYLNKPNLAIRFLASALSVDEDFPPALFQHALYLISISESEQAELILRQALSLSDDETMKYKIQKILDNLFP
jgi:tetratricopeptide (TPR) repeat protein